MKQQRNQYRHARSAHFARCTKKNHYYLVFKKRSREKGRQENTPTLCTLRSHDTRHTTHATRHTSVVGYPPPASRAPLPARGLPCREMSDESICECRIARPVLRRSAKKMKRVVARGAPTSIPICAPICAPICVPMCAPICVPVCVPMCVPMRGTARAGASTSGGPAATRL